MDRRTFLKSSALASSAFLLEHILPAGWANSTKANDSIAGHRIDSMPRRPLGKTGLTVSPLGFGMMRLPVEDGGGFSVEESSKMLRFAVDNGINLIDTAYVYGDSETVTGKALRDGYRDKVILSTKSPVRMIREEKDFDRFLEEQLQRLQTDVIDLYHLHGLRNRNWEDIILKFDLLGKMEKAKKAGKIRHIGFSFHSSLPDFKQVIDGYAHWDFCLIQLNYLDANFQAGLEGLHYAAERNIGVMIMEPLRGGYLANVPKEVNDIFRGVQPARTASEWAFDYLWDMPQVSCILSGMSEMRHVRENIVYAERSGPEMFSSEEHGAIARVVKRFGEYDVVPCTGCAYCLPCPAGVAIPNAFMIYNRLKIFGDVDGSQRQYDREMPAWGQKASECIDCGRCEVVCPQSIQIVDKLHLVKDTFGA